MATFLEKETTNETIAVICPVVAMSSTYEGSCKHLEQYWTGLMKRHDIKRLLRTYKTA